jgi:hypothetical protein
VRAAPSMADDNRVRGKSSWCRCVAQCIVARAMVVLAFVRQAGCCSNARTPPRRPI